LRKYLSKHEAGGAYFANAIVLSDGYDKSFGNYRLLAAAIIKTFSNVEIENIECSIVLESRWCKGFSVVRVSLGHINVSEPREGWLPCPEGWIEGYPHDCYIA